MTYEATAAKRPDEVARMFDQTARRYDLMNALMSLGQDHVWRLATNRALAITPGERVLDLAAGTGTSSAPMVRAGGDVVALDRSIGMVAEGRRRQPGMTFVVGDGGALPFGDGVFDVVTLSYGLRNMPDPAATLRELARVTRPGGRIVVCEFSTPVAGWFRALYRFWLRAVVQLAARLSSNPGSYHYLARTILDWPPQATVAGWMRAAGWRDVAYKNLTGGIVTLHRGTR